MLRITLKAAGLTDREVQLMLPHIAGTADDFYDTPMYDKLYEYFAFVACEMPYEVAKARTEDPDTWILEHLAALPTEQELQWLES
tara:strand:- start:400 stop:654 length:255 start_codon:yes stop_codon:yes gene_type:complete